MEDSDDFLTLPNLDEPNILHSLRWVQHCMVLASNSDFMSRLVFDTGKGMYIPTLVLY